MLEVSTIPAMDGLSNATLATEIVPMLVPISHTEGKGETVRDRPKEAGVQSYEPTNRNGI
jgi:hypothetical protein